MTMNASEANYDLVLTGAQICDPATGVRGDQVAHYLNKSDLILAVGSSLSPHRFSHAIPDAAKKTIIHCNVDELAHQQDVSHGARGDRRCALDLAGAPPLLCRMAAPGEMRKLQGAQRESTSWDRNRCLTISTGAVLPLWPGTTVNCFA